MIDIEGIQPKGTHGLIVADPPQLITRRVHYVGLDGETEIESGVTGRRLYCTFLLHDEYRTVADLEVWLSILEHTIVGRHGTVATDLGETFQSFPHTTFEGFKRDPQQPAPLKDYAGTIDGGWWIKGTLEFYQVRYP